MACRPAANSGILTSMLRSWVVCTALILGAVASTSGQTDVRAHMGSIEWAIRQVRWQFPTSFNVERVRSRRVLMLHLTESAASLRLAAAVGEWQQRTPVHDLEVICVWSSISKTELIRQAATLPESWMHADDRALALALQSMRSRGIPYATFYDRSGTLVWQGNADSALIQQLIAWMERDELPSELLTSHRTIGGFSLGVETSTLFVLRLRGAMYTDFDRFLWLSCIPEIGLGYVGRASITLGALVPVLGASVVPASVRLSATFNLLPKGAR